MRELSMQEAPEHFLSWVAEVEAGERIVVTRDGERVAEIRPYTGVAELDAKREAARKELLAIMDEGLDLGGVPFTYEERHGR